VRPRRLADTDWSFRGTCCLHFQGTEISVNFFKTTRCHNKAVIFLLYVISAPVKLKWPHIFSCFRFDVLLVINIKITTYTVLSGRQVPNFEENCCLCLILSFSSYYYCKYYTSGHYSSSCFYLKQRFGDWILHPSSGKTNSVGPNRQNYSLSKLLLLLLLAVEYQNRAHGVVFTTNEPPTHENNWNTQLWGSGQKSHESESRTRRMCWFQYMFYLQFSHKEGR
jgi:hypothetical protein